VKLFFRKYGSGPALIILHGLYGSSDNWVSIAKSLAGSFTVILPDQRNHGLSPHSDIHDYDSMAEDVKELADYLKLGSFFLAGHSMGGKCSVNFALKWPERLYGLLVADINPFSSETKVPDDHDRNLEILQIINSIDLKGITSRTDVKSLLSERIGSERTKGLIMKNLQRNSDNSFSWKLNAPSLLENFGKILEEINPGDQDSSPVIGFPVIFLRGENSGYLTASDFKSILEVFPQAEFIEVPGAGHWVHTDNPEAVKAGLLRLLDSR
jgi:esterase